VQVLVDVHSEINHIGFLQELDLCLKNLILREGFLKLDELQEGEHQVTVQVGPNLTVGETNKKHLNSDNSYNTCDCEHAGLTLRIAHIQDSRSETRKGEGKKEAWTLPRILVPVVVRNSRPTHSRPLD
jgi:hypothetical protein